MFTSCMVHKGRRKRIKTKKDVKKKGTCKVCKSVHKYSLLLLKKAPNKGTFLAAVKQAAFYCYNAKLDAPLRYGLLSVTTKAE